MMRKIKRTFTEVMACQPVTFLLVMAHAPLAFVQNGFVVGKPLSYEQGEEIEGFRVRIESALRVATAKADALVVGGGQQQYCIDKG